MKTKLIMNKYYELRRNEIVKTNVIKIGECRSSNFGRWLKSGGVILRNELKIGRWLKFLLAMIALGEKNRGRCADVFKRCPLLHFYRAARV